METKVNAEKLRELLSKDNKVVSDFERHMIQEGVKQLLLGTGDYFLQLPGLVFPVKTITPEMQQFLKDAQVLDVIEGQGITFSNDKDFTISFGIDAEEEMKKKCRNESRKMTEQEQELFNLYKQDGFVFDGLLTKRVVKALEWDKKGLINNSHFFGNQRDWNQTLITRINELSAGIHQQSLEGQGNTIVCSTDVSPILEDSEYFTVNYKEYDSYVQIGTFKEKYSVLCDPKLSPGHILVVRVPGNFDIASIKEQEGLYYGIIKITDSSVESCSKSDR